MQAELKMYEQLHSEGHFDDIIKIQEMNILTVHFRENPTNRQKFHIWTIPNYHPGIQRNLKAKAIPIYPVAARLMTPEEVKEHKNMYRQPFYGFLTWDHLISHENVVYTDNGDWEKILMQLSGELPCTRTTTVKKNGQIQLIM